MLVLVIQIEKIHDINQEIEGRTARARAVVSSRLIPLCNSASKVLKTFTRRLGTTCKRYHLKEEKGEC